jgi:indole-3-glycerol phosphate synthase
MVGFLRKMVDATRADVARPDYLLGLPAGRERRPPSFRTALLHGSARGAIVAEFKRRSPGAANPDLPQHGFDTFVRTTAESGVEAYSCLASRPEFGGSPGDVAELASLTTRPILFKDFVIEPIQIEAASRAGASAILLIARLEVEGLLAHSLRALADDAHARGLEVLLEWHGRSELRRTEGVPADVFGVNVRDLDSLEIRRTVADETIRAAGEFRPLIGMSGVEGPADAQRFWEAGVSGILVGTALSRASDPRDFLAGLRRPTRGTVA